MVNNKTKVLNIGVIGAGWWATSAHIPGIIQNNKAKLVAVQNPVISKAQKIAYDFCAELAFDDYKELVTTANIDAVVISSTPNMHFEQAKFALENGKHVLLEKPMTFTVAQAKELCDLATENNLVLLISCPWHYTSHAIEAKRLIQDGALGKVKMISILMTNPIDKLLKGINTIPTHGLNDVYIEPDPRSYSDPLVAGGGQIYTQVSHVGAYLSFLTDAEPQEVYAKFDYDNSENDIYDTLLITMNDETLVTIASTGATPLSIRNYEVRVYGTQAVLFLELWQGTMDLYSFEGEIKHYSPLSPEEVYPDRAPVSNFIDCCLGLAENQSPGRFGLSAMEIIEAAILSNKCKKPIKIEKS